MAIMTKLKKGIVHALVLGHEIGTVEKKTTKR